MNDSILLLIMGVGGTVFFPMAFWIMFTTNARGYRTRIKGSKVALKKDILVSLGILYSIVLVLLFI